MRTLTRIVACGFVSGLVGCAGQWRPRSNTQATIYATTTEIPVVMGNSTYVGSVDGVSTERGKGYVLVEPGTRKLTIHRVSCPLPILVVTCLRSASKSEVTSVLEAGVAYRVDGTSQGPIAIQSNGSPR